MYALKNTAGESRQLLTKTYAKSTAFESVYIDWSRKFKSDDSDVYGKEMLDQHKKFEDEKLKALLKKKKKSLLND